MMFSDEFTSFLLRAKKATYASGMSPAHTSRPASHDYQYLERPFLYIDSYLGGFHFIGEEAVWKDGKSIWGMNYYGKMLANEIPEGFSEFLKKSLLAVPSSAPFRGPAQFKVGDFTYKCSWNGVLDCFEGVEEISLKKNVIYRLVFHGGEIQG